MCQAHCHIIASTGEDIITFVDESLYLSYAKSSQSIDSGATIYITNLLQGFHTRTLQRGERHIKVANGVKAEVKAIRKLPLELNDGFVLKLTVDIKMWRCDQHTVSQMILTE